MESANQAAYTRIGDPALLDKIDKLFACNVGEYVNLPQLVVIGDQSSGKSSVLEGLTNLPFPRNSGLCTRFATKITFRRAPVDSVTVSVIPDPAASGEHHQEVKAWRMDNLTALDANSFADIMTRVQTVMGLSEVAKTSDHASVFSRDVLNLEIRGPEEDHLSIIDVPGIFRNTEDGKTTRDDIDLVKDMVQGYMKNPRSVMLAVVPASVDIATQDIIEMAKEVDPDGQRTLGVFTKPDLVDAGGENEVMNAVKGRGGKSKISWNVVRNLNQKQLTENATNRHALEKKFFEKKAPWNTLEKDRVGVDALRKRLQETLTVHIRREFPTVKQEISKKLQDCKRTVASFGEDRGTPELQRDFLLDLATKFRDTTLLALKVDYSGELFTDRGKLGLPTRVIERNDQFSAVLQRAGHEYRFEGEKKETKQQDVGDAKKEQKNEPADGASRGVRIRKLEGNPELDDVLFDPDIIGEPSLDDIFAWLGKTHHEMRGFTLGTFEAGVMTSTMRAQSKRWGSLALGYISDVIALVDEYINELINTICPDEKIRNGLRSIMLDPLLKRYRKARGNVEWFLEVEQKGNLITENNHFAKNLGERRVERLRKVLSAKVNEGTNAVEVHEILKNNPLTNQESIVKDIHDILRSYYEVASERFVDNVCKYGADYHLISGPETPLKLLDSKFISKMTVEQLEEIAGEDAELVRKRKALMKEIEDLEAGRKILL